jgi:hypothetical protein
VLLLKLLESTKSHQSTQANVIIAACTASGFNVNACHAMVLAHRPQGLAPNDLIFTGYRGHIWDSHYFRHWHLYPLLEQQRLEGDPYLSPYDGSSQLA